MGEGADVAQLSMELSIELARGAAADGGARAAELERAAAAAYVDPRTVPARFSLLKLMAECPAKYREACQQDQDDSLAARLGAASSGDRSGALLFGTAVHALLLGKPIALYPGPVRRGKVFDAFRTDCEAKGVVAILIESEWGPVHAVADAIRRHKTATRLLLDGSTIEQRIDWTWLGKAMRSTPDAWKLGSHVAELKTAVSAKPEHFVRQGLRLYYHAQAALYGTCLDETGRGGVGDVYVIAVEKRRPHPVSVLRFTERVLEVGARLCRRWIEHLLVCERANEWPDYISGIGEFDLDDDREFSGGIEVDGERVEW